MKLTKGGRKERGKRKPVSSAVKDYVRTAIKTSQVMKEYRTAGTHNLATNLGSATVASSSISYILKGDEVFHREGNSVTLKYMTVRWNLENNLAQSRVLRVLCLKEKVLNTSLDSATLFQDVDFINATSAGTVNRLTWPINNKLWRVINDRTITVPPSTSSTIAVRTGQYNVRLNARVNYYPNQAATTETTSGHYYIVSILGDTTTSATSLEFNFFARVFFVDSTGDTVKSRH